MAIFNLLLAVAMIVLSQKTGMGRDQHKEDMLAYMAHVYIGPWGGVYYGEWAVRIVNRLLRPLTQDLQVVNGFSSSQIRLYITTQNQTTLTTIRARMGDL